MANDLVNVRTQYTFLSVDGTAYSRDYSYYTDATATASSPKRIIFAASDAATRTVMSYGLSETFEAQRQYSFNFLVNRDEAVDMKVQIETASEAQSRILRPGEWMVIDIAQMDQPALVSTAPSMSDLSAISVACDFQSAKGELFSIAKSMS